jgi:hypothetical protein
MLGAGQAAQPLGLPGAMEGSGKGARGAVAGRDHQAALAQPRIDLTAAKTPIPALYAAGPSTVPSDRPHGSEDPFHCWRENAVAEVESMMNEVRRRAGGGGGLFQARIIESVETARNLSLLKDYQAYLRVEKGLRPLTCEAYDGDLKTFAEFIEGRTACC